MVIFVLSLSAAAYAWGINLERDVSANADRIDSVEETQAATAECLDRVVEMQADTRNDVALAVSERRALSDRMDYQTWLLQELYRQVTGRNVPER